MHVAPPEHGFRALELREAAVVAQHGPQLRVDAALYPVVRRRHRPFRAKAGVEVREQRAAVDEPDQPRPGLPQAPVRVFHATVDQAPLLEEIGPEFAPLHEALHPPVRLAQRLYMEQLLRQSVELHARLQPRPGRRMPFDLAERVKHASLHPRLGPFRRDRRGEPAAAVGDHHVGRGDPREQGAPRRGRLGAGEVPRQHMLVAAGYQDHAVAGDPYPVHVNDAMHLVDDLGHGPYRPEAGGPAPEGPPLAGHVELRFPGKQPSDERRQVARRRVVAVHGARPARDAPPPLRAGPRLAVPLHRAPAGLAGHIIHGILPESATFHREFPHATCEDVNARTHFLSERESRIE